MDIIWDKSVYKAMRDSLDCSVFLDDVEKTLKTAIPSDLWKKRNNGIIKWEEKDTKGGISYTLRVNQLVLLQYTILSYPACCGLVILSSYFSRIHKDFIKEILKQQFPRIEVIFSRKCVIQCICVKDADDAFWVINRDFESVLFELGVVLSKFRNPNTSHILYVIEIRTNDYVNHITNIIPYQPPKLYND